MESMMAKEGSGETSATKKEPKKPNRCALCRTLLRPHAMTLATTFELSQEERNFLTQNGLSPERFITFCAGCTGVLSEPQKAASIMRGITKLLLAGTNPLRSDKIANRYRDFILDSTRKRGDAL